MAGICGIAVTPLYYWDCSRHQAIMGRYPQPIREVLRRPEDIINPFDTCNIWNGDVRMGVIEEMRRRINKSRWERWRAKRNKELEKSYCYAPPPVTDTCEPILMM